LKADLGVTALKLGTVLRDHGVLARHVAHQGAHHLAQLLRVELVQVRCIDHGA